MVAARLPRLSRTPALNSMNPPPGSMPAISSARCGFSTISGSEPLLRVRIRRLIRPQESNRRSCLSCPSFLKTASSPFRKGYRASRTPGNSFLLSPKGWRRCFLFQSVTEEHVSVPVVPVQMMVKDYRLHVGSEDREILGLVEEPRVGKNVLCLVVIILSREKRPPTYNLFAPIVINAATRRGKQIMQTDSDYPSVLPLPSK